MHMFIEQNEKCLIKMSGVLVLLTLPVTLRWQGKLAPTWIHIKATDGPRDDQPFEATRRAYVSRHKIEVGGYWMDNMDAVMLDMVAEENLAPYIPKLCDHLSKFCI